MNSAIEMAQRLGCPAFDHALQKFLKGAVFVEKHRVLNGESAEFTPVFRRLQ
jgi:hypothetical protein